MRMPGLDVLRALAIVWVMLFHSFVVGGLGSDWSWLSRYGWMGVDLFFVLSGFLIGSQVLKPLAEGKPLDFADFYLRRAFRILPAYAVVLMLYLLLPWFREAPGMEPWWKFAGFFVNLSIDYSTNQAFSHAWSLCVEEHFYPLFPILAVLLLRRPAAWKFATLCIALVLAGIALRSAIWMHHTALDQITGGPQRNWFIEALYYPTWNRLDGLLFGVMLAAWRVCRPESWQRAQRHANAAMLTGLLVMAMSFWLFRDRVGLLGNSLGWPVMSAGLALLVFAGASAHGWLGRWRLAGASGLAAISYSLYLVHKAVFALVHAQYGQWLQGRGLLAFAMYAAAALLAGLLLHHAVERPFLRLRERIQQRRLVPAIAAG